MFDISNYPAYDDSNALVVGKMKGEIRSVDIEEFFGLKAKTYSILGSDSSEYKKGKGVNKNHSEYKDVLLNKKCLRHLKNIAQSKNNRI